MDVTTGTQSTSNITDRSWVRNAFFMPRLSTNATAYEKRSYNSSIHKFYDSSVGGNRVINPLPGFTPTADPRPDFVVGKGANPLWIHGQGGLYSSVYDDNMETVSFQFGVAEHNPLSTFMANIYDPVLGRAAKDGGIIDDTFFTAGRVGATLLTLPFQAFFGLNTLYRRLKSTATGNPYSKFYYMNPTMPLYLNSAQIILNALAANMFLAPSLNASDIVDKNGAQRYGQGNTKDDIAHLHGIMPDVFDENGTVNLYSIVAKPQRMANSFNDMMAEMSETATSLDEVRSSLDAWYASANDSSGEKTFDTYLAEYQTNHPKGSKGADTVVPDIDIQPSIEAGGPQVPTARTEPSFLDYFNSERKDGSAFITFRTKKQEGGSDTFSNTTKAIPLEEKINGFSSSVKDARTSFGNGNIGDNIIVDGLESAVSAVTSFVSGAATSVGLSLGAGVAAGVKVDMPEMYDASTMDYGTTSYELELAAPAGDKVSVLLNIYVPIALLLAGVLPKSTGKYSHDSPYLCRAFAQGKMDIKLGMIESITLDKFAGNIGKQIDGLPTKVNVTIKVKNMDGVMTAPITDSLFTESISFSHFDEPTALSDYLSALSGLSLYDQYYAGNRLANAWNKSLVNWSTLTSSASMANYMSGQTLGGRIASVLSQPTSVF